MEFVKVTYSMTEQFSAMKRNFIVTSEFSCTGIVLMGIDGAYLLGLRCLFKVWYDAPGVQVVQIFRMNWLIIFINYSIRFICGSF